MKTAAIALSLLMLSGIAFPATMNNPDEWRELARVGLLRFAYGWRTSPLISANEAGQIYTRFWAKPLKTGCQNAQNEDWQVWCPIQRGEMSGGTDCDNPNLETKALMLKNLEKSKTTKQYSCLYGG